MIFYRLLNWLLLACYELGLSSASAFFTNTRLVGVRDGPAKLPAIVVSVVGPPLAGLIHVLLSGGLGGFLPSLLRPLSWRGAFRLGFTLLGARYLAQEIYRYRHPRRQPEEVLHTTVREVDLRVDIAKAEGVRLDSLKGVIFQANELYQLQITTHEVRLDSLSPQFDGFTIAQVSDLHYGDFISAEFIRRYVALVTEMSPDLIALTGDYQQYAHEVWPAARILKPIGDWSRRERERGKAGAVAVMGNHDTAAGTVEVATALRSSGIDVLSNQHIRLQRDEASLYIAGVADPWSLRADLARTLLGIPHEACVVLLAHEPDYLIESAELVVSLQLSGHLHGGQIKLPFIGALLSPSRYNRRYIDGFHKRNDTLLFVSRGLGGHPPVRHACKPEIALLVLRSNSNQSKSLRDFD